jgi:hypothetical protein
VAELLNQTAKSGTPSRERPIEFLFALVGLAVAGFLILIIAGIQWTRFVATDRVPGWLSIPGKALWSWAWRLFLFVSIFSRAMGVEPWLVRHIPNAAPWVLQAVSGAVVCVLAVLATPFALSLTAAALGATAQAPEMRLRVFQNAGRKLYIGAAVVLAPLVVVRWLSNIFAERIQGPAAHLAVIYACIIALFLTVTAFAGYLGRLYAKSAE